MLLDGGSPSLPPSRLLHTVACDSMDHWFAPVKRRGELGFPCLLHCSTSHAIITVHQSSTMLNVYLPRTGAHQTWRCCRGGMQVAAQGERLISTSCFFFFFFFFDKLLLSGVLDAFTRRGTQRPLMQSSWRAVSCMVNVKDAFGPAVVSTPCKDTRPGGVLRVAFLKKNPTKQKKMWGKDGWWVSVFTYYIHKNHPELFNRVIATEIFQFLKQKCQTFAGLDCVNRLLFIIFDSKWRVLGILDHGLDKKTLWALGSCDRLINCEITSLPIG